MWESCGVILENFQVAGRACGEGVRKAAVWRDSDSSGRLRV